MEANTIIEVTNTLIGFTEPIGDTFKDKMSYENQLKLIELTESCLDQLINNAKYKDRSEFSAERIGVCAVTSLKSFKEKLSKYV